MSKITIDNQIGDEQLEIIEKYDKEQKTRSFDKASLAKMIYWAAVIISLYHFITSFVGAPATLKHRSLHVSMMLFLSFILYPASDKASRKKLPVYDTVLALLSLGITLYVWIDYPNIIARAGLINRMDMIVGTCLVVLVLEASRRISGLPLTLLAMVFIAYALFGRNIPGIFSHRGYDWSSLVNQFFISTDGIYGTSVGVASSYIFLFILFGEVMNKSGMGKFFNDIALALAGSSMGGPAKVAVIASGFLGSINGSAIANVVTTGTFTIPLMKKTGYSKEFAGAVEATASVGGQLLPPIMGATAFIMAEMVGIKYSSIIVYAAIPAILYYIGIIIQVHFRASKRNLVGLPKEELPKVGDVMKESGHLLIPIVFLLGMLFFSGKTVVFSAFCSILVTIATSMLKKNTRMSLKDMIDALASGAKGTVSVAMACAIVGIIIAVTSITGFGLNMANAIIQLGGTSILATLIFTMVTCMILGMGLPSIPAYLITATIAAPALVKLGIPVVAAHLFVFYFAMFANLTPPVALAAFAAAGLSGGDPMKTGIASVKLALAGFIIPYMFVFNNEILLLNTTWLIALRVAFTSIIGVMMIGVAIEGYLLKQVPVWLRAASFLCALLLITANVMQDMVGFAILAVLLVQQMLKVKKEKANAY
ncbi:TRAP transporter, 4TM/12TM fusion protein [Geosporobacter subterraneus DSM 17957]|uniref:TRAP transporter, 4TM/12TM fusion protein n=1 Tax=Geosporobacter subterraneus DSM 17957 TaxID=1121919 RepID=A0A1M6KZV8_9FIRM|nr:TRAP transporter permease [Geosporobacter subterraneus]SHJ64521.1 TRAP transporter, 4TM/12TM fusion protein [Geosporobacter subterraneus DSM 17957]